MLIFCIISTNLFETLANLDWVGWVIQGIALIAAFLLGGLLSRNTTTRLRHDRSIESRKSKDILESFFEERDNKSLTNILPGILGSSGVSSSTDSLQLFRQLAKLISGSKKKSASADSPVSASEPQSSADDVVDDNKNENHVSLDGPNADGPYEQFTNEPTESPAPKSSPIEEPKEDYIAKPRSIHDTKDSQKSSDFGEMVGDTEEALYSATPNQPVDFTVFTPKQLQIGDESIIDVWAFFPDQFEQVKEKAKAYERDNLAGATSGIMMALGTQIDYQLDLPGFELQETTDFVTWMGIPSNCSFYVKAPSGIELGKHRGVVSIFVQSLLIGKIKFHVRVGDSSQKAMERAEGQTKSLPKTAFASYSSKNTERVSGRLQGIKKIAPDLDIFWDRDSLVSGQDWEIKLKQHVASKDIFYLFWSEEAAQSEWVDREWKMALDKRGLEYIDPVPLCDPRDAPPPAELGSLHFNDKYLMYEKYEGDREGD